MAENGPTGIHIRDFALKDRLSLLLHAHPQLIDTEPHSIQRLKSAIEKQGGFGFTRAKLPKQYAYIDPETNKEYPDSRTIMLRVTKDSAGFRLTRVPGLHVVTGSPTSAHYDVLRSFIRILEEGFHGADKCNVFLTEEDAFHTVTHYGYPGNTKTEKSVTANRTEVNGDMYKLLLNTGFTRNYLPSGWQDSHLNQFGEGTISHCPPEQILPHIILKEGTDTTQRVNFYRNNIQLALFNRIRILDSQYKDVKQVE